MTPERRRFLDRLTTYLIGVALGCLFLGLYWQARHAYMQRAREESPAAVEAQEQGRGSEREGQTRGEPGRR